MKINKINCYKLAIYLIIILNIGVLNINSNKTFTWFYFSIAVTFLTFFIYLISQHKYKTTNWYNFFIVSVFAVYGFQLIRLKQQFMPLLNVGDTIKRYDCILFLLLVYPIQEILKKDPNGKFLSTINYLGIINLLIRSIVWGMYNFKGINIAPGYFSGEGGTAWTRELGSLVLSRMAGSFLDPYLLVFSLILIFYGSLRKEKIAGFIELLFLFSYQIFISQGRVQVLLSIILILFMFLLKSRVSNRKVVQYSILILLIFIIFVLGYHNILAFFQTFSSNNLNYGGSTLARMNGFNYFFQEWKNNIWIGMGFLPDQIKLSYDTYYLADYGTYINIFEYGLLGGLILVIPLIYGISEAISNIKLKVQENKIILLQIGLTFYIVLGSPLYNYYWMDNITLLVLYFGLTLFSINSKKNEQN